VTRHHNAMEIGSAVRLLLDAVTSPFSVAPLSLLGGPTIAKAERRRLASARTRAYPFSVIMRNGCPVRGHRAVGVGRCVRMASDVSALAQTKHVE
jgi:hypothetical protein